jgi:DNA helicase-2/ATP-dependent DNA helicase PcrA
MKESGLESMYRAQAAAGKTEADLERLDNLAELVSSAREFELSFDPAADPAEAQPFDADTPPLLVMLRAYLESIALVADADAIDPAQGAVTLMTLHAAKGLEFGAAAIIGLEEGLLPHSRAFDSEVQLEEERRLLFVGITRAMRRLLITSARYRTVRGLSERTIPSRFLDEFGETHVTVSNQADAPVQPDDDGWDSPRRGFGDAPSRSAPPAANDPSHQYPVGSRVRHPQFGTGTVRSVIAGANARAVIEFQGVGVKTMVLEYARLQRLS